MKISYVMIVAMMMKTEYLFSQQKSMLKYWKNLNWLVKVICFLILTFTFHCSYNHRFVDGTFDVSPLLFRQLFTIHAIISGRNIPLVYSLLPNKTTETYEKLYNMLKMSIKVQPLQPILNWLI